MFSRGLAIIATLAALTLPTLAAARENARVERVAFTDGRAMLKGRLKGYEYVDYVFPVGAGESMRLSLKTNRLSNYFNVIAPGADAAMFIGSTSGKDFSGTAPVAGDYTARVYLMRSAARRGTVANYRLAIDLGQKSATDARGPDFADGLTGGPDYWEVFGLAAGDSLSLRDGPSPRAKRVGGLARGAILKNHGCRNDRGERWCQVEDPSANRRGWAKGRYLRESAGPK
ncbi:MAG: SH3 domain-containing protein [Methylocystis sp.]|uniref:SH3 domain-containing protein n=1 Tax=Methylocystis sp. TaxID=1911079 RepID=UPI003D0D953C